MKSHYLGVFVLRFWITITVAAVIGATLMFLVVKITEPSAIHMISLSARNGVAYVDGSIILKVHRQLRRDCPQTTDRQLVEKDSAGRVITIYPLPTISTPFLPEDQQEFSVVFDAPKNVKPGNLFFEARTYLHCVAFPWLGRADTYYTGDVPLVMKLPPVKTPPAVLYHPGPVTVVPSVAPTP